MEIGEMEGRGMEIGEMEGCEGNDTCAAKNGLNIFLTNWRIYHNINWWILPLHVTNITGSKGEGIGCGGSKGGKT